MVLKYFLATCLTALAFAAVKADDNFTVYDEEIIFTVFKNDNTSFVWELGTDLTSQGCDKNGKFAFIVHGFLNSVSLWGKPMADQLNKHRGGCVMYMNWGKYSDSIDYRGIVFEKFEKIADVLVRRLQHLEGEGVSVKNMFLVGHSLGARLVLLAGAGMGGRIPWIDALDPAGPLFIITSLTFDPKTAAENVQCVHTSIDFGTTIYNCHQDWLMGNCGKIQCAAKTIKFGIDFVLNQTRMEVDISHNLANVFYIRAFDHDFVADNCYRCLGSAKASELPVGFKMGYLETRRNSSIVARIASSTGNVEPYNGKDCCAYSLIGL